MDVYETIHGDNIINSFSSEYQFLSNMYVIPTPIVFEGIAYASSENLYQAQKSDDVEMRLYISTLSPRHSKVFARTIDIIPQWNKIKFEVMSIAIDLKFEDDHCRELLLSTENKILIEGNSWGDEYWGVSTKTMRGHNHLGKMLMRKRRELKNNNIWG